MVIKVKLKPETIYDFDIDDISAAIDNNDFEGALKIAADCFPELERIKQLKRIEQARASRRSA